MFNSVKSPCSSAQAQATKTEDARDLLAQLYREIGISAVAAALHAMADKMPEPTQEPVTLAILRDEQAA